MKRIAVIFLVIFTVLNVFGAKKKKQSVGDQLVDNINIGWEVNRTSNYRWRDFHIGTAYGETFDFDSKASWQLGLNYNWNKYTLYGDRYFAFGTANSILRNQSFTVPLIANYRVYKSFLTRVNVYTGPVAELILTSTLDRTPFHDYNALQMGWTFGARLRFLAIFKAKLSYSFYPTALFNDGTFNRSAVGFSLGF